MKREGRRHQNFRIMPMPPLNTAAADQFESPLPPELSSRYKKNPPMIIPSPSRAAACKSKKVYKAKGTHKVVGNNSFGDSVSDLRLASCWRVVYSNPGLHYSGFSASQFLDRPDNDQFHTRSTYVHDQDYYLDDEKIDESGA